MEPILCDVNWAEKLLKLMTSGSLTEIEGAPQWI